MAVDPQNRYSNEAERVDLDIYNDFKYKKRRYFDLFDHISAL